MTIQVGDQLPDATFMTLTEKGPAPIPSAELFGGKTVVLFALPGAFTPTCSAKHVPSYVAHADELKSKGVDTIACLSVNDAFVMGAWGKDQKVGDKILMLADGNGDFTKKLGLELDLAGFGMGLRSKRYALVAKDGKVVSLSVEPNPSAMDVSSAQAVLASL
ncbi:peroxiredoxin [Zavarzinia sp.]|uniref:peroxiredoxin n=1 Tax=Zavarzinia sp. TaxID=2027920 RepID=UPI003563B6E1